MNTTKPIRCLVVDDEPPARDIIRRYIAEMPMLELAGECGNAIEALGILQHRPIDLVFLDIQMPQLKGTELVRSLKNPPKVIFTTAHPDYALEGYELDVVDYLLKPIQFDRFVKAVNKTFQPAKTFDQPESSQPVAAAENEPRKEAFVYFRSDRKMVKVMLQDILYVESMKDYVKIYTTEGVIITKQSITSVEAMLPELSFIRVHRSFIVSIGKIKSYTHELVEIEKTEIPIGKLYRNEVRKVLGVVLAFLVSLCAFLPSVSAQKGKTLKPVIEPCACPVVVDSSFKTRCGYLIVPENRKKNNDRTIKLPFVMVLSNNPHKKKDPVLFTSGGPGNSSLGWATGMSQNKNILLNERDCIAFEQRGTRYALPYLRSFELDTAIKESYRKNLSKDSMVIVGIQRYRKKLEARGIDLSGYNSDETVADIDDLLRALEIDSVNLFGGSYSGGLMMAVLQKDPARVRSLVLDSPLPMFIPVDEDEPAHFNEALDILFRHCETDSADQGLYGGLKEKFRSYFTSIIGKELYIPYLERGTTDTIMVQYTKNELLDVIEGYLLDYKRLKDLPFVITEMIKGHHDVYIRKKLDDIFNKNTAPDGMRISVYCADEAAYHNEAIIRQLYHVYPYMEGYHINDVYKAICDCWPSPPIDPLTKQAFYSDKPVLLADGEMDPACCPLYIDMIHHYMPNSQRFLFINRTHGVGGTEMNELKQRFLDSPYKKIGFVAPGVISY